MRALRKLKPIYADCLTPEQAAPIEVWMRPCADSRAGFLGKDESLIDVALADARVLQEYGITHQQVADRLTYLSGRAFRKWNMKSRRGQSYYDAQREGAVIDGKFRFTAIGWMGSQNCPFVHSSLPNRVYTCGWGSHDFAVENMATNERIKFPELMLHLVGGHHFFEGKGTSYRLEPADAVRVLDLKPGVDYSPKMAKEVVWVEGMYDSDLADSDGLKLVRRAKRKVKLAPGVVMHIRGDDAVIMAERDLKLKRPLKVDGAEMLFGGSIESGQHIVYREVQRYVVGWADEGGS